MAKFQYNRFLEHSGKPKKPPLLSQRMEDNRISFRIDEVKELNDKLWLMGKDTPLKTGFKIKEEDKPTFSPLIPPTWSDREFTQWTNSFELDEIRRDFIFDIGDFDTDAGLDIDLELPPWFITFYPNESGSGQTNTQDKPDTVQTTTQIPEGTEVPLLGLTLSPIATQHTTPESPLVYTVTLLNFDGEAEPVDYDMLVPINISSDGAIDVDYELSNIIPASAFGIEQGDFYDVAAFAIILKGETSVDIIVTPINPGKTEPVEVTMAVMPIFAFTKDFNPIDNPEVGSPDGTSPIDNLIMPEVESTQTGYLTPSLLTADYQFIPSDQDTDLPLEDKIPQSEHCSGTSQTAPYLPGKGFYLGTIETTIIASANIEAYPSTTTSFTITPIDPDATQYWGLGDPVNMTVTDTDNAKVLTINVSGGTISDSYIVHRGSIPIVTSDPFTPTNLLISPSKWKDNNDNPSGKIDTTSAMPPYKPSLPGKNPTSLNGQKGAPNKYDFTSPPLWDYTVSFPNNAPPGAFIKPTVGAEAIKANPYNPAVIQFPDKIGVDVPAQVWNNNNSNPLQVGPLACLNYRIQVFLELYSTYPNNDPEDTTVRIPEGHEDPLQIIIRIVLLGDVGEDYFSEEMPLAVSLAGTATPDTDYTILGEGQTPISGTGVLADYQFSENVLGVYVPAGVLNAQLKEVTIQVPVAILLDEEKEGDETIEVTPLFPEQPEEGSTPLILWESYETTIAIILGQLADILYNFKVLQDGGKLEGFGQDLNIELPDIITIDIPTVAVGGGATYTFPQDSELFVCYVYLQLSDAPLGSSITANVYNTSLPGSPTILDSILTVPAGQTKSNPVVLSQTQFSNGDVLQVAILSVGSEFPGAGMQLFLGRKEEGEKSDWERFGLTNTGNGYITVFKDGLDYLIVEGSGNFRAVTINPANYVNNSVPSFRYTGYNNAYFWRRFLPTKTSLGTSQNVTGNFGNTRFYAQLNPDNWTRSLLVPWYEFHRSPYNYNRDYHHFRLPSDPSYHVDTNKFFHYFPNAAANEGENVLTREYEIDRQKTREELKSKYELSTIFTGDHSSTRTFSVNVSLTSSCKDIDEFGTLNNQTKQEAVFTGTGTGTAQRVENNTEKTREVYGQTQRESFFTSASESSNYTLDFESPPNDYNWKKYHYDGTHTSNYAEAGFWWGDGGWGAYGNTYTTCSKNEQYTNYNVTRNVYYESNIVKIEYQEITDKKYKYTFKDNFSQVSTLPGLSYGEGYPGFFAFIYTSYKRSVCTTTIQPLDVRLIKMTIGGVNYNYGEYLNGDYSWGRSFFLFSSTTLGNNGGTLSSPRISVSLGSRFPFYSKFLTEEVLTGGTYRVEETDINGQVSLTETPVDEKDYTHENQTQFTPVTSVDVYKKTGNYSYLKYSGSVTGETNNKITTNRKEEYYTYTSVTVSFQGEGESTFINSTKQTLIIPSGDYSEWVWNQITNNVKQCNLYLATDKNGNEVLELAISEQKPSNNNPTPIQEETRRADIYRFDTQTQKWKRMPNAVSAISPLTAESDFINYHATPQTETLTNGFICPEK